MYYEFVLLLGNNSPASAGLFLSETYPFLMESQKVRSHRVHRRNSLIIVAYLARLRVFTGSSFLMES